MNYDIEGCIYHKIKLTDNVGAKKECKIIPVNQSTLYIVRKLIYKQTSVKNQQVK